MSNDAFKHLFLEKHRPVLFFHPFIKLLGTSEQYKGLISFKVFETIRPAQAKVAITDSGFLIPDSPFDSFQQSWRNKVAAGSGPSQPLKERLPQGNLPLKPLGDSAGKHWDLAQPLLCWDFTGNWVFDQIHCCSHGMVDMRITRSYEDNKELQYFTTNLCDLCVGKDKVWTHSVHTFPPWKQNNY